MTKYDLACAIADEGGWEEFHQKRHNYTMYDYHKARRLQLEREYRSKYDTQAKEHPQAQA